MQVETVEIDERFRGPPGSGNGGYTCGLVARHLPGTVTARLKAPPPLATPLRLESSGREARLFDGDALIAEARCAELELHVPHAPSFAAATQASRSYPGFTSHNFPGCFVCGPERAAGDGMHIFPGPLEHAPESATPWIPDPTLADASGRVRHEFLWAALDCPGALAYYPLPEGTATVLGELTASFVADVAAGERCTVLGWRLGTEGRKRFAGTAIHGAGGRLVAYARAIWIDVPPRAWNAA